MGSDLRRLLGASEAGEPPPLSPENVALWGTRLEVVWWMIETATVTIFLPQTKLTELQELLAKCPKDRRIALDSEICSENCCMFAKS